MQNRAALICSLTAGWFLPGCVTYTLPVKYEAPGQAKAVSGSDPARVALYLPPVVDRRTSGMRSLNVCMQGGALTFQTDRPPAEIVHDALESELSLLGIGVASISGGAQGTLRAQIKQFETCQSDDSFTVDAHVELFGLERESLWAGELQSRALYRSGSSTSADFERNLTAGFSRALTEAIQKLNHPGFMRAVKSLGGELPPLPSDGASPPPPIY